MACPPLSYDSRTVCGGCQGYLLGREENAEGKRQKSKGKRQKFRTWRCARSVRLYCPLVPLVRLRGSFCLLPFAFCLLPFAFCLLPFAFCLLPFAFCLLPFAFCLLPFAFRFASCVRFTHTEAPQPDPPAPRDAPAHNTPRSQQSAEAPPSLRTSRDHTH